MKVQFDTDRATRDITNKLVSYFNGIDGSVTRGEDSKFDEFRSFAEGFQSEWEIITEKIGLEIKIPIFVKSLMIGET